MVSLLVDFEFLGLLRMLEGGQSPAPAYGDGPPYARLSSRIPEYHDEGHIRQARKREREQARRAQESRRHRCP